ncbi:MAG: site-2 protease family protein [Clostridiales bacterium]|nr:site-2 protease family protein [Clostridiales bacterium]
MLETAFSWLAAGFAVSFLHELGHFTVAALRGWPVAELRIGAGPTVFRAGMLRVRLLPFGGGILMPVPPRHLAVPILWGGLLTTAFTTAAAVAAFFSTGQHSLFLFGTATLGVAAFFANIDPGVPGSDGSFLFGARPTPWVWVRQGLFLTLLVPTAAHFMP